MSLWKTVWQPRSVFEVVTQHRNPIFRSWEGSIRFGERDGGKLLLGYVSVIIHNYFPKIFQKSPDQPGLINAASHRHGGSLPCRESQRIVLFLGGGVYFARCTSLPVNTQLPRWLGGRASSGLKVLNTAWVSECWEMCQGSALPGSWLPWQSDTPAGGMRRGGGEKENETKSEGNQEEEPR